MVPLCTHALSDIPKSRLLEVGQVCRFSRIACLVYSIFHKRTSRFVCCCRHRPVKTCKPCTNDIADYHGYNTTCVSWRLRCAKSLRPNLWCTISLHGPHVSCWTVTYQVTHGISNIEDTKHHYLLCVTSGVGLCKRYSHTIRAKVGVQLC